MISGAGGAGGTSGMTGAGGAGSGCEADITTDPANCGACGVACAPSQICAASMCQTLGLKWQHKFPMSSPSQRLGASMVYDSKRQVVVLFGGMQWPTRFSDTWEWNGVNWTKAAPLNSPPARDNASMIFDEERGVTVLFGGGYDDGCLQSHDDTWEYDGITWKQINTPNAPQLRWAAGMVYDAARKVSVLFGGSSCVRYGDTWEYDGTNWTIRQTKDAPSPRLGPTMVYDPIHEVVMLSGGNDGPTYNDTWLYDGANWTQPGGIGFVPPRTGAGIAPYLDLGVSVLFGGWSGFVEYSDTNVWNGSVWTPIKLLNPPSARDQVAMTWDGAHHQIVLFGGNSLGTVFGETWVLGP